MFPAPPSPSPRFGTVKTNYKSQLPNVYKKKTPKLVYVHSFNNHNSKKLSMLVAVLFYARMLSRVLRPHNYKDLCVSQDCNEEYRKSNRSCCSKLDVSLRSPAKTAHKML